MINHYAGDGNRQTTGNFDIGKEFVKRGHHVTIIASSFSHYTFREERLLSGEEWKEELREGVRFIWLRTPSYHGNEIRRVLNMLAFSWHVIRQGAQFLVEPDIIIGTCPHTFGVFAAYVLARRNKAQFAFEIRDLWPQTLVDVGALSEWNPITWAWRAVEKFLYVKAAKIITIAPGMAGYVSSLGISSERIVHIPNGVDLRRYAQVRPYDGGRSVPFTLVYLGGHARYNGVGTLVEAAAILDQRGITGIRFLIVGDGPQKPSLVKRAQDLGLGNIEFRPLVPKAEIGNVLSEASAFLHHITDIPVLKFGISSNKLFDYMASARPIIFAVNSSNNPVEEASAGLTIPSDDPEAIAKAILDLVAMTPERRLEMGRNARRYVEEHHDVRELAIRLEAACLSVLEGQHEQPQEVKLPDHRAKTHVHK